MKVAKRLAALMAICPACDAPVGVSCIGVRGERKAVHAARMAGVTRLDVAKVKAGRVKRSAFYRSDAWRIVRYEALKLHGGKCQCCGAGPRLGAPLHVDHVMPRSKRPDLELSVHNLQVLCDDCNLGKGAHDTTDWRPAAGRVQ